VKDGVFPQPFPIGSRAVAFDRLEVEEWIRKKKLAERRRCT